MEVRALFGRFVWRGVNIDDVEIHPSRGSRINPTLNVCEQNRGAHASPNTSSTGNSGCSQGDRFSKHFEKCRNREGHVKASVFPP